MRIFFTASFYGKGKYQKEYDLVLETIKKYEKNVVSPELGNYLKSLSDKEKRAMKDLYKIHYQAIRRDIQQADAVIIEISNQDFQLGHEATLAVNNKKQVLCLSIHEDMSRKIDSKYFFGAKYNHSNLDSIVKNFIERFNKGNLNSRFNMFLTPSQLTYLNTVSKDRKMNSSEYIRYLIDKDRGVV